MMTRFQFLAGMLAVVAGKGRRRKPVAPAQSLPSAVERAQLLAAFSDATIQAELDSRFLKLWTVDDLEAELARRSVRRKIGQ